MDKKAQAPQDVIIGVALIVGIAITGMIAIKVYGDVQTGLQQVSMVNNTQGVPEVIQKGYDLQLKYDILSLALLIGFAIGMIILGYFIDTAGIFMPMYIGVLILGEFIAVILHFVYNEISANPMFVSAANQMPISNHILSHIGLYYTIIAIVALIVTYAKPKNEAGF